MIRSKPSTDAYREAWERVFGEQLDGALRDAVSELEPQRSGMQCVSCNEELTTLNKPCPKCRWMPGGGASP